MAEILIVPAHRGGGEARKLDPLHKTLSYPKRLNAVFDRVPLVDPKDYRPHDLEAWTPPIGDQDGVGECNACTTTETLMTLRAREGLKSIALSPASLYAQINGGIDEGSLPEDALQAAMTTGIAPVSTIGYTDWQSAYRSSAWKTQAAGYKLLDAYFLTGIDQAISAILNDRPINVCMAWYDGDSQVDSLGCLPVTPSGSAGGHSILGRGVYFLDVLRQVGPTASLEEHIAYAEKHRPSTDVGNLLFKIQNHWTTKWGIAGCAFLRLSRIVDNFADFRMWAGWSSIQESIDGPQPE